ncbi:hypothetical protein PR048_011490 [Dryococelus australis]|uniref:Uncharacterized protein n=1 Tax=Dryococelus australis TaxID=614101 RepID=A0ABQ9HN12_9NEOP|nr:hypothetical protein PR048_011490 [Dryococelus australis]
MPSRYCRHSTNKLYRPMEFKNISNKNNFVPVKEVLFTNFWRTKHNIGIQCPKKYRCVICEKHNLDKIISGTVFAKYLSDKEFARIPFECD